MAWWCYSPGLSGGFLFDDFNNLDQLGAYGRIDNLHSLLLYLSSGGADPTGRPLSLLSFLIDARDWPAEPAPFKRTSLVLHLVNGALLAWTLLRLGHRLPIPHNRTRAAALLGAALWTLHPLLVSTTLYVVQREAMLPTTFALLGMLLWLEGTRRWQAGARGARSWMLAGAWGCTALATLSKANGILLPLLLLVMDWIIPPQAAVADTQNARSYGRFRVLALGMPSMLLAGWLVSRLPAVFTGESFGRPWTLAQRLLSEPRVICDYLRLLWLPQASSASVFNDSLRASTDWLHPWSTLPAAAAILLLLVLGLRLRRNHPAIALAILFYLAGQLLESTVIPLELYFEHRNYLPAMPMFWPLALWLTGPGSLKAVRTALAASLPVLLAVLCHARAEVWGRPYEQALLLAEVDPDSPRAQANAAAYERAHGRPEQAAQRLAAASRRMPDEVQIALNWIGADCELGGVSSAAREATHQTLSTNRGDVTLVQNWMSAAIDTARDDSCPGLDLPELDAMLRILLDNPNFSATPGATAQLQQLQGKLALAHGDAAAALRHFDAGLAALTTPDNALIQAALLGSAGFPREGLQHLRYYGTFELHEPATGGMPQVHRWLLRKTGYWDTEFAHMQQQLTQDARAVQPPSVEGAVH